MGQALLVRARHLRADLERQRVPEELADVELGHRLERLATRQPFDGGPGLLGQIRLRSLQLGEKGGDIRCTHASKFAVSTPDLTMTETGAYWVLHSDYLRNPY